MIFKQITSEFIDKNIQPGKLPLENHVLRQSSYFSYRNDKHGYVYDPHTDPYKNIVIDIPNQPIVETSIDEKSDSDEKDSDDQAVILYSSLDVVLAGNSQTIAKNAVCLDRQFDVSSSETNTPGSKTLPEEKEESKSVNRNTFWQSKLNAGSEASNDFCCFKSCVIL